MTNCHSFLPIIDHTAFCPVKHDIYTVGHFHFLKNTLMSLSTQLECQCGAGPLETKVMPVCTMGALIRMHIAPIILFNLNLKFQNAIFVSQVDVIAYTLGKNWLHQCCFYMTSNKTCNVMTLNQHGKLIGFAKKSST